MAPLVKKFNNKSQNSLNKPSFKRTNDAVSTPTPLPLDDDVPNFPRGGGRSLPRDERNGVREKVDEEFDLTTRDFKWRKNKVVQSRSFVSEDDKLGSSKGNEESIP